jgi:hypothetical protein
MIASPQDDRADRMRYPAAVVDELSEIETARFAPRSTRERSQAATPDYTLDYLRVPILEEQARARQATLLERVLKWARAHWHT